MSFDKSAQLPIRISARRKSDVRTQFAALCFRIADGGGEDARGFGSEFAVGPAPHLGVATAGAPEIEICLVTSRGTGRWILPKGWPMDGQTPAAAAATEAWEEAGLTGQAYDRCLGVYSYIKPLDRTRTPCVAMVFPLLVRQVHANWPERKSRKRRWFGLEKAAARLDEPELRHIVQSFDPNDLLR